MAESIRFTCSDCGRSIAAWSDGKPFYINEAGEKVYAYHPNHAELMKCIANDTPHLCLQCGREANIDSRFARVCPDCGSPNVISTFQLEGVNCPSCPRGRFVRDRDHFIIS